MKTLILFFFFASTLAASAQIETIANGEGGRQVRDKLNNNFAYLDTVAAQRLDSLIDAGIGGGETYTAGNGATLTGTEFKLGGTLTEPTTHIIADNTADNTLRFIAGELVGKNVRLGVFGSSSDSPAIDITGVDNATGDMFNLSATSGGLIFDDLRSVTRGIEYNGDYSAELTEFSLAPWGKVWKLNADNELTGNTFNYLNSGASISRFYVQSQEAATTEHFVALDMVHISDDGQSDALSVVAIGQGGPVKLTAKSAGLGSLVIEDFRGTPVGLEYSEDISAFFGDLSVVNKKYVLDKTLEGSASLNFASTTAATVSRLTVTVTGAALGDPVSLGIPSASVTATGTFTAWVSATNTVTVQFSPKATEDPAIGTFKVTVHKP